MGLRKCPVCGGKLRSESLGWICYDCKGFIDMQGVFHEHKEKPFAPPQTNADRIRAMSDEELARFFADKIENEYILIQKRLGHSEHTLTATQIETIRHTCYCIWMKWLKQPAE